MANESTAGGTNESAKKGQAQQGAKGSEQQARSAGGPSPQQQAGGERETSQGLSRRAGYEPGALAIPGFGASPFSFMRRMMDDLDRLFEEFGFRGGEASTGRREMQRRRSAGREAFWAPDVDVFEREGKLVVRADLPGLSKDDVRVAVQDGVLVIEGERRQEREVERSGTYRAERIYGSFSRVIPLPEGVDPDTAEAHFENGVLEVSLRMSEEKARGKRIEIQEGKQASMH
jgi:HSP20 family protein